MSRAVSLSRRFDQKAMLDRFEEIADDLEALDTWEDFIVATDALNAELRTLARISKRTPVLGELVGMAHYAGDLADRAAARVANLNPDLQ